MRKKNNLLIFIVLYLFFVSCSEKTAKNIDIVSINPNEAGDVKLSEFIDTVLYIKLQTDSACLTGVISDVLIRDKYIYLNDMSQKSILVFDKQGKHISSLKRLGKGEGEYLTISGFFVDSTEQFIQILDGFNDKLYTYKNIDFTYLKEKNVFHIVSNTVKKYNGFLYYSTHRLDNIIDTTSKETTNADIIICKDNKVLKMLFAKKIVTNHNYFSIYPESFIINDENKLFASIMFDNTFYQLNNMDAIPILKVDFQNKGIDNKLISEESTEKQMKFIESPGNKGKAMLPFLVLNNKELMSFSYCVNVGENANEDYSFPIEFRSYIYIKKHKKVFHAKHLINDLTDFPNEIWIRNFNKSATVYEPWYKDYLVYIISPSFELGNNDKILTQSVGEIHLDDNPIIMLLKLK